MMKNLVQAAAMLVLLSVLIGCTQAAQAPPPADYPPSDSVDDVYQPEIDPADFVAGIDNPYFLGKPGTKYIYEGETEDGLEHIEVEVLAETREVMGVTTTVVRDTVYLDGEVIEDTWDWYAQDKEGNVWYFGEDTNEYEDGEVVSTAGAWEAGVDGALPGIIMYADPAAHVGEPYRQEFYEGEAEDMAEILSVTETESVAYGSFDNLLLTKEWTPLEPDVVEHKYYAPGVGHILEVMVEGGSERLELIDIQTQN